jgi:PAS domain S-box-containing protein
MRISLRTLLIVPFVLQVVGITGLVGYFSFRSGQQAVTDLANRLIDSTSQRVSDRLTLFLTLPRQVVELNHQAIQSGDLNPDNLDDLELQFFKQIQIFPSVTLVSFGNVKGEVIGAGRDRTGLVTEPDTLVIWDAQGDLPRTRRFYRVDAQRKRLTVVHSTPEFDVRQTPWYQAALASNKLTWTPVVPVPKLSTALIGISQPIYQNGQLKGILNAGFLLADVNLFLSSLQFSPTGQVFVIERSGNLVASSTQEQVFSEKADQTLVRLHATKSQDWLTQKTTQELLKRKPSALTNQKEQFSFWGDRPTQDGKAIRQQYFVNVAPYQDAYGLDWLIIIVVPESEFMGEIYHNLHRTLALCGVTLLGSLGLGIWTSRRLTRPLLRLNQTTQAFATGNLDHPVPPTRITEVAELSQSFCQMADQLNASFRSLREGEQKFSILLDCIPVGVSVFDANGKLLIINRQGAAILGQGTIAISTEEVSKTYRVYVAGTNQLYPTERLPAVRALQGETVYNDDMEIEVNGHRVPLEVQTAPVIDENGQVIYAINAFQDISDRRQSEQLRLSHARDLERQISEKTSALRVSQTKLSDILDNTIATIFNFHLLDDLSVKYQYISNGCFDLYGYTPQELTTNPNLWRSRVHAEDWQNILVPTYQNILKGQTQPPREEFRYHHQNGSLRWITSRISARWDEAVHAWSVTVVNTDITERKQTELELQRTKEVAEAANQAKSSFLANMSHELRSPLNAILGFARLLKRDPSVPPAQQENAAIIERSGEHLLNIINQVLDLAKIEAKRTTLNATDFDLGALLNDVHDLFRLKAIDQKIAFRLDRSPDLPKLVHTDEMKLRQVLINLLDNAFKFTDRGYVTLRAALAEPLPSTRSQPSEPITQPQLSQIPTRIQFEIEDSGSGIDITDQQKLFEAFSQTQRGQQKSGTGLGLTISREFVRLMGGDIQVESQLGQGSRFRFDIVALTQCHANAAPSDTLPIIGLAPGQPRYRCLIVDDNPSNRRLLAQLLKVLAVDLQEAANGMDAIALWKAWQPDLIWMDLRMPDLDGYETTRRIRQLEAAQPTPTPVTIIAISATTLTNQYELAIAAGCNDFIFKPFAESEIFAALQCHLGVQHRYAEDTSALNPAIDETCLVQWINALPQDIQTTLKQAVILGYTHKIRDIIHQIEAYNPELANLFHELAEEFEYTQILYFLNLAHPPD